MSPFCQQIDDSVSETPEVNDNNDGTVEFVMRKFIKLPTQVAFDEEGNIRCDFPFDQKSCMKDIKLLKNSTINAVDKDKVTTTGGSAEDGKEVSTDGGAGNASGGAGVTNPTNGTNGDLTNSGNPNGDSQAVDSSQSGEDGHLSDDSVRENAESGNPNANSVSQVADSSQSGGEGHFGNDDKMPEADLTIVDDKESNSGNSTMVVNDAQGGGGGNVQLLVKSNIAGVVNQITRQFKSYTKGLKNVKVDINSSPVVQLQKQPEVSHSRRDLKSSVTGAEADKIKIYVDDELLMEKVLMRLAKAPGDATKGSEIG